MCDVTWFNPFNFASGRIRNIRHRHLQITVPKRVYSFLKLTRICPTEDVLDLPVNIAISNSFFWLILGLKVVLQKKKKPAHIWLKGLLKSFKNMLALDVCESLI